MLPEERIALYRRDPVAFVRHEFGVDPDEWQVDALRAWADPTVPRISMQACAGPGKSAVVAWMVWNFLACYGAPGEHPKGFACSVTSDNLSANLWAELAKWRSRSAYLTAEFIWTAEKVYAKSHQATWFVGARSWPKTASPEEQGKTLSGLHGKYVAAFVDESGAIPKTVLNAADQALSTGPDFGKIVQAGNPISLDGMLYAAANELAHLWHVIRITGDPDDPKRSQRINVEWAREQIAAHGRDNPWVKSYILGQFPPSSLNALLGPDDVRTSMARAPRPEDYEHAGRVLGVDVAREGDDRSVIFPRQGVIAFQPQILRNVDSIQGAGAVGRKSRDWNADAIFVDGTGGFGAGWIDALRSMGHSPMSVQFAGSPNDKLRYANKRTEMWCEMANWVRELGALPNIPELLAELTVPLYGFQGDKLLLEPKDLIKKRIGRSPDLADALALTFAQPTVRARASMRPPFAAEDRSMEYNPF